MRLQKILELTNQIEKTQFLKILDGFLSGVGDDERAVRIDEILSSASGNLKTADTELISELFSLLEPEFRAHMESVQAFGDRRLGVLVDILMRDGNGQMSREWLGTLYGKEDGRLRGKVAALTYDAENENLSLHSQGRERDFAIYRACLETALNNDLLQNREAKVAWHERTILNRLSQSLGLTHDEERTIEFSVDFPPLLDVDTAVNMLRDAGIIFYQRKTRRVYIADEIAKMLREIHGLDMIKKHVRRVLSHFGDPEINRLGRSFGVDRTLSRDEKQKMLLDTGLSMRHVLSVAMHKETTTKSERAARVQALLEEQLCLGLHRYGRSLDQKIDSLIGWYADPANEEGQTLSGDGYARLLSELSEEFPELQEVIRSEFELEDAGELTREILESYSIYPKDVLYLLSEKSLRQYCKVKGLGSRGEPISRIMKSYRNVDDLLLENISLIGGRDLNGLAERGLKLREAELGIIFEKLVRNAFSRLGLKVDDEQLGKVNTSRDKMDILISLGDGEYIIVECKTSKDKHYDNYTGIKRQLLAYERLCTKSGLRVRHVLAVANEFSEDFVGQCEYDEELSLSLLTTTGLKHILDAFVASSRSEFPVKLLLKAGLLNESRIAKVLSR